MGLPFLDCKSGGTCFPFSGAFIAFCLVYHLIDLAGGISPRGTRVGIVAENRILENTPRGGPKRFSKIQNCTV